MSSRAPKECRDVAGGTVPVLPTRQRPDRHIDGFTEPGLAADSSSCVGGGGGGRMRLIEGKAKSLFLKSSVADPDPNP